MALKKFTAKIDLGKVDGYTNGRKTCAAEVRVDYRLEVKTGNGATRLYWEFAASGAIWNHLHTDIICGGQCLDHMSGYASIRNNKTFREVYEIGKRWHLNGLKAGSPAQEEALKEYRANLKREGARYDYTAACEFLRGKGLLEDEGYIYNAKPYHYGSAWLVEELPEEVKARIRDIVGITKEDEERAEAEARKELENEGAAA